jgi:hypothetical protein
MLTNIGIFMKEHFWGYVTSNDKVHVLLVDESTPHGINQARQQQHVVKILPIFLADDFEDAERQGYDVLIKERTEALDALKQIRESLG